MGDWSVPPALTSLEWEHLRTQVLASPSPVISFTGLNTAYKRLFIAGHLITPAAGGIASLRFNGDTTTTWTAARNYWIVTNPSTISAAGFNQSLSNGTIRFNLGQTIGTVVGFYAIVQAVSADVPLRLHLRAVSTDNPGGSVMLFPMMMDGVSATGSSGISRVDVNLNMSANSRVTIGGARDSL